MSLIIMVTAILASLVYLSITLLSYVGRSSSLTTEVQEGEARLADDKRRLTECQAKIRALENELPQLREREGRMQRWVALLKQQHGRLEAGPAEKVTDKAERDAAIRKAMSSSRSKGR